ncbi:MAG: DUF1343 domain-containing protein [Clostridia bacterium]|nr:DUF1343 domain-containing protein [Clostridia bacterium]
MMKTGIDRINEYEVNRLFENRRIALISAASGVSSGYRYTVDIFNEKYKVVSVLSPEHGPRGVLGPGEKVRDGTDKFTKLKTYSLFEDFYASDDEKEKDGAYMPSSSALADVDAVVFDMQDVGSRYFTYASTLFYAMKACGRRGLPLILLDRPNPIGGKVEGCCSEPDCLSFIGLTPVPIRHGMTLGELARYYNGVFSLGCDLTVVGLTGWKRDTYFDETGLPFVRPSPNLPTFESVCFYNGTCMLAGTNVTEGRGTTQPFSLIGAPYIDPIKLADRLNSERSLYGVKFSPAFFIPHFSKYKEETCYGVRLHLTDKRLLEPVRLGIVLIKTVQDMYPDCFEFLKPSAGRYHIDLSCGNSDLRTSMQDADALYEKWNAQAERFRAENEKYYLYD